VNKIQIKSGKRGFDYNVGIWWTRRKKFDGRFGYMYGDKKDEKRDNRIL